ncbi:antibiotic biosynthesis monooxygenase [Dyadobacter arcticus]|uniref:Heme-degrading monooxygenase HmoA n=1 Tax=Dyadobacter arcticus TaxID=1078754 RepID=A0ABX0UT37_9BACT|nr:antibiotic biosynthesis monooxygenase [Dyadobacter arcticus]NIJ56126.1 heme-degrading monooxygenase HmoA [Dyadobacter arcticus]
MINKQLNVIVRFELKEEELETLVSQIRDFFEKEVSRFPGFISAKIHQNQERTVLINYATWDSSESFQKFVMELASVSPIAKKIQAFNPKQDMVFEILL